MKTLLTLLLASTTLHAQRSIPLDDPRHLNKIGGFVGNLPKHDVAGANRYVAAQRSAFCRDPLRTIDDRVCDLRPLFTWHLAGSVGQSPMPQWKPVYLEVISSSSEGILARTPEIWRKYFPKAYNSTPFIIRNYPVAVTDGTSLNIYAVEEGLRRYTDVLGAVHTVKSYNYGVPHIPRAGTNDIARASATNALAAPARPRVSMFSTNQPARPPSGKIIVQ